MVYCSPTASGETINWLNAVLSSWRFDKNWVGDIEWAGTLARRLLPSEVKPLWFRTRPGSTSYRKTEAEVVGTTVYFRFTYCPEETNPYGTPNFLSPECHWWEIKVPPTGVPVMTAEGGRPLVE